MKSFVAACLLASAAALPAHAAGFLPGSLVVSVEGNGVVGATSGSYTDNQAAPLTLFNYTTTGTSSASYVSSLVLPQTSSGANNAISGEYGSSSEGILQLSANGKYLTIAGYGVNAATFNANPTAYGTAANDPNKPTALGQSTSLTNTAFITVPRVVALIDAAGNVDTTTALTGVFNGNNPRSVATVDGTSFYLSGQGNSPDSTGGVFYAQKGATTATAITGNDTNKKASAQDTRVVEIVGNQLFVSADSKEGSGNNRDFIGTLGTAGSLPTTLFNSGAGPTQLAGFGNSGGTGKLTITALNGNGINAIGSEVNLSPESFFFADSHTLYVADAGISKNDSALNDSNGTALGDGGLQKWVYNDATKSWSLVYTISAGLNLVANNAASGVTGLLGLTGQVVNGQVSLYATSYTIGDLDQSYLYGVTDTLTATNSAGISFDTLAAAPVDSNFKGVAFAPTADSTVPEPATWAMMVVGFGVAGAAMRRRTRALA
jgi:hypothetical protein